MVQDDLDDAQYLVCHRPTSDEHCNKVKNNKVISHLLHLPWNKTHTKSLSALVQALPFGCNGSGPLSKMRATFPRLPGSG